ncbi:MAG TPA: aldo/keto reductase [Vicinamibacterales bacterium]|nr:aldo/keto reductase [Vicinamibacterales bacterium]HPW21200.1 aldo/keto reductase [Vicinamibacterales bacterium]
MQTRQLGTTDLHLTPIGFGAWAIGGPDYAFGWGPQEDSESIAAIHRAIDAGINWIDTAAVYGLGRSERVVAKALAQLGPSRRPFVFTKGSLVWNESGSITHALAPASLRKEVDDSLRRLGTDVIDLYQIHWPEPFGGNGSAPEIEEAWRTLLDLRQAGKIRHLGVSNFDEVQLARVHAIAPVASLQPPYSMLRRGIERAVLPYCLDNRIGVIVYSPMAAGALSGTMTRERAASLPKNDWRSQHADFREPKLSRNLALVEVLRGIGSRHGVSPGVVAVAWTLRHPAVTAAIVGLRSPSQVDGIAPAGELRLTAEEIAEIEPHVQAAPRSF